jgi:predicted permease
MNNSLKPKKGQPPRLADKLLEWFCAPHLLEELQGDLHEEFYYQVERVGLQRARYRYWWDVIGFIRPFALKRKSTTYLSTPLFSTSMLHNYFKIALRSLLGNRNYAYINIFGLAVGIAACLLIFLVVQFELSFDTFHTKKDQIYRVVRESKSPQGISYDRGVQFPVGPALRNDFPQLAKVAMIFEVKDTQVDILNQNGSQTQFKQADGLFFIEPEFFHLFDFAFLSGDALSSLSEPNSVVLAKSTAEKYFGDYKEAIGKLLRVDNQQGKVLKVTGILEDVAANSDFPLKVLISFSTLEEGLTDWHSTNSDRQCYVLLPQETNLQGVSSLLPSFSKKYLGEESKDRHLLQPLRDIHFDSRLGNYNNRTMDKQTIAAISLIGFFLLATSCINFINLTTAQAFQRSKEIGIRKAVGSYRFQLINQFLSETFVITLAALVLGVAFAALIIPFLKQTLELHFEFSTINIPLLLLFLLLLLPLVTLLAGSYPALILSAYNPIEALKGKFTSKGGQEITIRKGLVIFQFMIAQVLIICTLIVVNQMQYLQKAPWGFNKEAVITLQIPRDSLGVAGVDPFRNRLQSLKSVKNVSFSLSSPASSRENFWNGFSYDQSTKEEDFQVNLKLTDANYFNTYEMEFVAGRAYVESEDIKEIVVNETLLKKLGVRNSGEAIGKNITLWGKKYPIVGVVKDFHISSLKQEIAPVLLTTVKNFYWTANIRLQTSDLSPTLKEIENSYKAIYPQSLFEYEFVDEMVANFYREEKKMSNLLKVFVGVAIAISCLGLYGLVSFMAAQKVKEIGIRKVLGASILNIVMLLSKDFLWLVGIAFVIASPIAWYAMNKWLQDFQYSIKIGIGIFALAGLIAFLLAMITVSWQAIKAALANPIKSLKSE